MGGIYDIPVTTIDGRATTLAEHRGEVLMIVNVASRCGFTPQYEQLERLQRDYGDRGFSVLGFPCNQFMGQEPGSNEQILDYCTATWGVTFPMFEKVRVNGPGAIHPLFKELRQAKDSHGKAGPVRWNFEKFLVLPSDEVRRFRSATVPDDPTIVGLIEANLPVTA